MKIRSIIDTINMIDDDDEYDVFIEENLLNEGLLKTWPLDKTISILKNHKVECDQYKDKNVFHVLIDSNNRRTPDEIIALANNLGWIPSYVYYMVNNQIKDKGKYEEVYFNERYPEFDSVMIKFEAKYDIRVEKIPQFLYHITSRERALKIMTLGLIPKSHSVTSNHPPRVYLGRSDDEVELMIRSNPNAWKKSRDGQFTILKISTRLIPKYFQIYKDPNSKGHGYFTLNTIPKNAIEVVRTFSI